MKKNAIAAVALAVLLTLSSCGRTTKDVPLALEDLIGEYEYLSDDGAGKLTIKKLPVGMIFPIMYRKFPIDFWPIPPM